MSRIKFAVTFGGPGYDIRKAAPEAEALGYDGLWTGDHVMTGRPIGDCLTQLAAAAVLTSRVDLISGVLLLPLRHPIPVAKALTHIDRLSDGRLIAGLGVGGEYPNEWLASGVPPRERGARMDEGIEVLTRVWTEESVTHDGRFYPFEDVTLLPRPVQQPHPRLWFGGRGPACRRRTASHGAGWFPYLMTPERYADGLAALTRETAAQGRAPASIERAFLVFVGLTDLAAYDVSKDPTNPGAKKGNKYYLIGPTEECIASLKGYVDAGVEYFAIAWVGDPALTETSVRHFATEVAPEVRRYAEERSGA